MNDRPNNPNAEPGDADFQVAAGLAAALRRLDETKIVAVPPERDRQILSQCHDALVQRLNAGDSRSVGGNHFQSADENPGHEPECRRWGERSERASDVHQKGGLGKTRPAFPFIDRERVHESKANRGHEPESSSPVLTDTLSPIGGEGRGEGAPRFMESSSQVERPDEILGDELTKRESAGSRILRIPFCRLRWVAAAAIVVLAFASAYWARRPAPDVAINIERPTIVDAFALARRIDAGRQMAGRFDLNKDGRIDRTDVDLLAQKAVVLPEGGAL